MNYVTLRNGVKMPQLGYGVYQVTPEECERCGKYCRCGRSCEKNQGYLKVKSSIYGG